MPVGAHTESVVYNPQESWGLHVQKNYGFSLMPRHSAVFEPWRTLGILSGSSCFLQVHSLALLSLAAAQSAIVYPMERSQP